MPREASAFPTAWKSDSHSKEKPFPQQGKAVPSCSVFDLDILLREALVVYEAVGYGVDGEACE